MSRKSQKKNLEPVIDYPDSDSSMSGQEWKIDTTPKQPVQSKSSEIEKLMQELKAVTSSAKLNPHTFNYDNTDFTLMEINSDLVSLKETEVVFTPRAPAKRYFIPEDAPSLKLCLFCRLSGHVVKDCKAKVNIYNLILNIKEIICGTCNTEHQPTRCPASDLCFKCLRIGHRRDECTDTFVKKVCTYCDAFDHATVECNRVWRQYKFDNSEKRIKRVKMTLSCHLCGTSGHFGDVTYIQYIY